MTLTDEAFPRLSHRPQSADSDSPACLGPFTYRVAAQTAVEALQDAVPDPAVHHPDPAACPRRQPLRARRARAVRRPVRRAGGRTVLRGACRPDRGADRRRSDEVLLPCGTGCTVLSADGRFDQAALARDRLSALAAAVDRRQRLGALAAIGELVAGPARRAGRLGADGDPVRPIRRRRARTARSRSDAGGRG